MGAGDPRSFVVRSDVDVAPHLSLPCGVAEGAQLLGRGGAAGRVLLGDDAGGERLRLRGRRLRPPLRASPPRATAWTPARTSAG